MLERRRVGVLPLERLHRRTASVVPYLYTGSSLRRCVRAVTVGVHAGVHRRAALYGYPHEVAPWITVLRLVHAVAVCGLGEHGGLEREVQRELGEVVGFPSVTLASSGGEIMVGLPVHVLYVSRHTHSQLRVVSRRQVVRASVGVQPRDHLLVCVGLLLDLVQSIPPAVLEDMVGEHSSSTNDDLSPPSGRLSFIILYGCAPRDEVEAELALQHAHALPHRLVAYGYVPVEPLIVPVGVRAVCAVYLLPPCEDCRLV